jgi:tetratricopeptide (TPR) repeat protein
VTRLGGVRRWMLKAAYRYHRRRGNVGLEDGTLRRLGLLYEQEGDLGAAVECFELCHAEHELARICREQGDDREAARRYRELRCYFLAAEAYGRLGDWQQAARCYHLSGSFLDAAICWERWLEAGSLADLPDEQAGSALGEIGLCHDRLGQTRKAAGHYRRALELLDAAAARHEEAGRWQQARAAYLAIAHVGHSKGTYESIACGLAGAIRVSRSSGHTERRLLGYYDDFIHFARRFGEDASAAELCLEAAELAPEPAESRRYLLLAGDAWYRSGDFLFVHLDRPELAESSYHAAIESYLRAREHSELAGCYGRLAVVADPARREGFAALARSLAGHRPARERREAGDPAALLGVAAHAGAPEVQAAYFRAIRRHPPDTDFERFEALSQAFDVLSDEGKRSRYAQLVAKR